MFKRTSTDYQVGSVILNNSDKKKRKLEHLDQNQVNSGSSCTNDETHEFVKHSKEVVFQQTDVKYLQTFKEIRQIGKITYGVFFKLC